MNAGRILHRHVRLIETTQSQFAYESASKNRHEVTNVESHDSQHATPLLAIGLCPRVVIELTEDNQHHLLPSSEQLEEGRR